ncbi:MAG: alpha-amylase family glycosyl hydrolase [Verrucomicrobiota bacterium]
MYSVTMPRRVQYWVFFAFAFLSVQSAHAEAMLSLFQQTWSEVTQRMPEMAEAGYDSLWLPPPTKGNSGTYSVGYDVFDPFDLGSTNQCGTIATAYGTESDLLNMVQTAHRFGIRVYFDNVMNHRASVVPGYPGGEPTNYFPGLLPADFHLQVVSGGYSNWPNISDWCYTEQVQNNPLEGLCDLANEPGTVNWNFGAAWGDTTNKPVYIRFPGRADLYMDTNGAFLGTGWGGAGWRPFDGNGQPVAEDVTEYECRAVAWEVYMTKCDGFRLDAVKQIPVDFFGAETGQTDDPSFSGYTGAIQAMYDYVHGYGSNVTGNGYVETDGNRNSLFNTEATRNDAMLFGEYEEQSLAAGSDFNDYLNSGMRLENFPLFNYFENVLEDSDSMSGMDGRDFSAPTWSQGNCDSNGNFSGAQAVNFPMVQDPGFQFFPNQEFGDSYFFMHEGLPMVYADGFNHNTVANSTPTESLANYLGEFSDNTLPDIMYAHNQLARGGTWSRWSDQNIVMFERYDYREGNSNAPSTQDVVLFGLNDMTGDPADISFDDGVTRTSDGYYRNPSNTTSTAVSNSRGLGIVVGFPPGTVLTQLASSSPTGGRAYTNLLVHGATGSLTQTTNTANDPVPANRLIYVGSQTLASGGGAIELTIPTMSWVMYGIQWPQASQANALTNAIVLRQGGAAAPQITVYRSDGTNGPTNYSPIFPFKMRGSVNPYTGIESMAPGEGNVSNLTYAINIPIVTNANFDILVNSDASTSNTLVKLDGGIDLNSQMGLGPTNFQAGIAPTNFLDLRDNPPGYADDVFLGYEQAAYQYRNGPEKFAARSVLSNTIVALGAETYYYTIGGSSNVVSGSGFGQSITNETANWIWHDPTNAVTSLSSNPPSQMYPLNPTSGQSVEIWVKIGYQFQINTCFIYYTTDGSNPEGAFGVGEGTTQVAQGNWVNHDNVQSNIDWWMGTIPGQASGEQVRYKIGVSYGGSANPGQSIQPISYAEPSGSKLFGLTQFAITNFNPATAVVWLHNDLNPANTTTGLRSGFHILRARTFLPRAGQSSVYNTFLQTFYYDGPLPGGVIVYPSGGTTITSSNYTVVVRADSTVTGVNFNIQASDHVNDDIYTGQTNGIGNSINGAPFFLPATPVNPNSSISLQYPNYLQEYHFVFNKVPPSGTATIYVQLNEYGTAVYTNHYTMLTAAVNTLGPEEIVQFSSPPGNGSIITMTSNTIYQIRACYTPNLDTNVPGLFNLAINGVIQPLSSYFLRLEGFDPPACSGMNSFYYFWSLSSPGTVMGANNLQLVYSNNSTGIVLSNAVSVLVAPPLAMSSSLGNNNQIVSWSSAPGVTYEILATTNLTQPFLPIGTNLAGQGSTTSFTDTNALPEKFYLIEAVQQ